jgi:hypothetical protein
LERAFDLVERAGQHDRAAVHLGVEPGLRRELGQPVDRDVHLDRAATRVPPLDVAHEVRRQIVAVDEVEERDLRVDGRHDGRCPQLVA